MTNDFERDYAELEDKFKLQVKKDRKVWKSSVYLPNMRPPGPVDFLFVGMEPSLGGWAKTPREAEELVEQDFKNFLFSIGDFILHYCIRNYLCQRGGTYHITDLSKGTMLVADANKRRRERYLEWYLLFVNEFDIVKTKTTKVIAIGNTLRDFLKRVDFKSVIKPRRIEAILHYSNQAGGHRKDMAERCPGEFERLARHLSLEDIREEAKIVLDNSGMSRRLVRIALERLENRRELTPSQKQLIFTYKKDFEAWTKKGF